MIPAPLKSNLEMTQYSDSEIVIRDPVKGVNYRFPLFALKVLECANGELSIDDIATKILPAEIAKDKIILIQQLFEKARQAGLLQKEGNESEIIPVVKVAEKKRNPLLFTLAETSISSTTIQTISAIACFLWLFKWGYLVLVCCAIGLFVTAIPQYWNMMQVYWLYSYWPETIPLILLSLAMHECGHLATATAYGSQRVKAGVGLFLLAPVAFIKILDFRMIPSKSGRVRTALAGNATDLVLFSVAFLIWRFSDSFSAINQISLVISSFILLRLFVNSLPFLRFDGYIAIAEAIQKPKLREESYAAVMRRIPGLAHYWQGPSKLKQSKLLLIYGLTNIATLIGAAVGFGYSSLTFLADVVPFLPPVVVAIIGISLSSFLVISMIRDILLSRQLKESTS